MAAHTQTSTDLGDAHYADVAIVTALQVELEAVLNLVGGKHHWIQESVDQFLHYFADLQIGDSSLRVVACALWKYGGDAAAAEVARLKALRPRLLVMSGICAGWREQDINLGDVIVADRAFRAGAGKQTVAGLQPDVDTYRPPPWLMLSLRDFASNREWQTSIDTPRPHSLRYQADWLLCQLTANPTFPATPADWAAVEQQGMNIIELKQVLQTRKWLTAAGKLTAKAQQRLRELEAHHFGKRQPVPDPPQPRVHVKAFASSPAVVAVENPFLDTAKWVRSVGAMDMEVASFFQAAAEIGVPAFAVKGVSDYGTPDADDTFHTYAAEAAARWIYSFITTNWPLLGQQLPRAIPEQQRTARRDYYVHIAPPGMYVSREGTLAEVKATLLGHAPTIALTSGVKGRPIALHGMGGIGKSVIARALCDDPEVQAAFPDGILWITLGKQPDLIGGLRAWIRTLGGVVAETAPTPKDLQINLANLLGQRACLLVADDVWNKPDAEYDDTRRGPRRGDRSTGSAYPGHERI
jgi:nucleoside phosphorylase